MSAISEQKRTYSNLDHGDWVRWWNAVNEQNGRPDKKIDFYWADNFPIRTPTVLRAVLVEPKLVDVLCKSHCLYTSSSAMTDDPRSSLLGTKPRHVLRSTTAAGHLRGRL